MSGVGHMNNPENKDYSEHIYGKGKGTHFGHEELFAYLHQPNRNDDIWKVMHQHMLSCPACRAEVAGLEQAEYILRTTLSSENHMTYPSITKPVMDRIYEQQQAGARHWFGMQGSGRLSLASVAVIVVVLFAIIVGSRVLVPRPTSRLISVASTPISTIGSVQRQQATPTPTAKPTSIPSTTVVATDVPQGVTLQECTSSLDEVKQHLRICGSNFKAGDNIVFILVDSKGKQMKEIGPIQVLPDGTFSQNILIRSCKDVPSAIYAQDTSIKSTEVYQKLTGIWYLNC